MGEQIVIFGSTGLIGSNVLSTLVRRSDKPRIFEPTRDQIESEKAPAFLKGMDTESPVTVFYCHGPTDPRIEFETHRRYHVELPERWRKRFLVEFNLKAFITLGSALEERDSLIESNNYFRAKRLWLDLHRRSGPESVHAQLHSVYGNPLRPHSFLGQMVSALKSRSDFSMSSGIQRREYHRADDVAEVLDAISRMNVRLLKDRVARISHGSSIALRDLAAGVFGYFGQSSRLKIGALSIPPGEAPEPETDAPAFEFPVRYRPTIEDVIRFFEALGVRKN